MITNINFKSSFSLAVSPAILILSLLFIITPFAYSQNWDSLIMYLNHKDPAMRLYAVREFGKVNNAKAIKHIIASLKDSDFEVKRGAIEVLIKVLRVRNDPDPDAVKPLLNLLGHEDYRIRMLSAEALGVTSDARAIAPLIAAMGDSHWDVWAAARIALGKMGVNAADPLILALQDKNEAVRSGAASALGEIRAKQAFDPLIAILKDGSSHVRANASIALGKIGDIRAIDPLLNLLKRDDSWLIREEIESALIYMGKPAVEPLLVAIGMRGEPEMFRSHCIRILGQINDLRAVEPIINSLLDKSVPTRVAAAESLGELKDVRGIYFLIKCLSDKAYFVRKTAARSLGKMGEPAIKALASTLDNSEPSTRIKAAEALSYINTEEARQILISGLRNRDLQIIAGGVSFFVERAEPGSEPVIIEALNKYGDKEVAEILINSGNKELEQAALEWVKKGGYKLIPRGSSGPRWGGK